MRKTEKFGGSFFDYGTIASFENYFKKRADNSQTLLVVSAMRGITRILRLAFEANTEKIPKDFKDLVISMSINEFYRVHMDLIKGLFTGEAMNDVKIGFERIFLNLKECITLFQRGDNEDAFYASLLKFGEFSSSLILNQYLGSIGVKSILFDARDYVVTNGDFKEASILNINPSFEKLFGEANILVTQGFIGKDQKNQDTVLGFDGSDLSAAHFAVSLGGDLVFWKDVKLFKENPDIHPEAEPVDTMANFEFQNLPSHPIRPDAIDYAIKRGVRVSMKCFLCPGEYEALIQ